MANRGVELKLRLFQEDWGGKNALTMFGIMARGCVNLEPVIVFLDTGRGSRTWAPNLPFRVRMRQITYRDDGKAEVRFSIPKQADLPCGLKPGDYTLFFDPCGESVPLSDKMPVEEGTPAP